MERRDPAKERPEAHTGNREFPGYHTAGQGRTGKLHETLINPTPQGCFSRISNIELTPLFSEKGLCTTH